LDDPAIIPDMDSSSTSIFPLLAGFGAALGLTWSWWVLHNSNPEHLSIRTLDHYLGVVLITGLASLIGALVGSRMSYLLFHWSFYSVHTNEILMIWKGGLDWGGAILGAAIVFLLVTGLYDEDPRRLANHLAPLWVILLTFLWLAAGWSSVYYGPTHAYTWWTVYITDQSGESHSRIPINLIGAFLTAGAGFWFDHASKKYFRKFKFLLLFCSQMTLLLVFSFLRADPVAPLAMIPSDLFFASIYLGIGLILLVVFGLIPARKKQMDQPDLQNKDI
jgi:prolipoprotein diacylglyceryltransferase